MWIYLSISLLLIVISWLVFMPVSIVVNTIEQHYYIKQAGSFKVEVVSDPYELFYIKFRLLFFGFNFYPLKGSAKKTKSKKERKKEKTKRQRSTQTLVLRLSIIKHNLLSFKIRHFHVSLDTGSVITNAYLFPLGAIFSGNNIKININNLEGNSVIALIENTLFSMIKATLKTYIKHHFNK